MLLFKGFRKIFNVITGICFLALSGISIYIFLNYHWLYCVGAVIVTLTVTGFIANIASYFDKQYKKRAVVYYLEKYKKQGITLKDLLTYMEEDSSENMLKILEKMQLEDEVKLIKNGTTPETILVLKAGAVVAHEVIDLDSESKPMKIELK